MALAVTQTTTPRKQGLLEIPAREQGLRPHQWAFLFPLIGGLMAGFIGGFSLAYSGAAGCFQELKELRAQQQ